jgi:hypothetical protein
VAIQGFIQTGNPQENGLILKDNNLELPGQSYMALVTTSTPTGTTATINWNNGNNQVLNLGSASGDVTLTFTNPQTGAAYLLKIVQHATVAKNVVWPANACKWPAGATPTISVGANAVDMVALFYDGSVYRCNWGGDYK